MVITALSTLITNLILGSGIWTFWQIVIWAFIGLLSGFIGKLYKNPNIHVLALYSFLSGLLYGFLTSILKSRFVVGNFWSYYLVGLPFDISHAIGNLIFFYLFYPVLIRVFKMYNVCEINNS